MCSHQFPAVSRLASVVRAVLISLWRWKKILKDEFEVINSLVGWISPPATTHYPQIGNYPERAGQFDSAS
ncbi:MAG: hypothetical protein JO308_00215 [Verrucomicrobia bacterium]|nr:hypothetical protein [Verrucomicrobiota bacterium]